MAVRPSSELRLTGFRSCPFPLPSPSFCRRAGGLVLRCAGAELSRTHALLGDLLRGPSAVAGRARRFVHRARALAQLTGLSHRAKLALRGRQDHDDQRGYSLAILPFPGNRNVVSGARVRGAGSAAGDRARAFPRLAGADRQLPAHGLARHALLGLPHAAREGLRSRLLLVRCAASRG